MTSGQNTTEAKRPRRRGEPAQPGDDVMTIDQVAALLGCSAKTVRRMIAAGTLACSRPSPRVVRINRADVLALVGAQGVGGQTTPAAVPGPMQPKPAGRGESGAGQ